MITTIAAEALSFAQFGQGSGPIVLDNIDCHGDELSILECDFDPDTSDCTHFEDAGIRCGESPSELFATISFLMHYSGQASLLFITILKIVLKRHFTYVNKLY